MKLKWVSANDIIQMDEKVTPRQLSPEKEIVEHSLETSKTNSEF